MLGVGPPAVHGIKELSLETLEKQIMTVMVNDKISENAKALGEKLKSRRKRGMHHVHHADEYTATGKEKEEGEELTTTTPTEKEEHDEEDGGYDAGDGVDNAVAFIKEYLSSPFRKRATFRKLLVWQQDEEVTSCNACDTAFNFLNRRHHCRGCGRIFCADCLYPEPYLNYVDPQLVCEECSDRK